MEEQSPQGLVDVGPMSMYKLIVSFEKRGHLDLKVTGHIIDRPAAVKRVKPLMQSPWLMKLIQCSNQTVSHKRM